MCASSAGTRSSPRVPHGRNQSLGEQSSQRDGPWAIRRAKGGSHPPCKAKPLLLSLSRARVTPRLRTVIRALWPRSDSTRASSGSTRGPVPSPQSPSGGEEGRSGPPVQSAPRRRRQYSLGARALPSSTRQTSPRGPVFLGAAGTLPDTRFRAALRTAVRTAGAYSAGGSRSSSASSAREARASSR